MEVFDISLINWSRAQFALTAIYHWLFVPLTLGITFLIAIMETIYYKTGKEEWKKMTKFWMTVFGINFAIGVAIGLILEFEFGTNWSYYSWFVGDIFGAPLAIEGIMAFFMESTFIAIMFFGWNKVSKGFHLTASWLTAIGSNLSALWILVANGWMQNPVGMQFNPETVRNEMVNFWDVLFNPSAINKFVHTLYSSYTLSAIFVIGISSWYLLKNREHIFARKSIIVASIFGLIFSLATVYTGDESAREVAVSQPMKFAAMEGLYKGSTEAPLVAAGIMVNDEESDPTHKKKKLVANIEIPGMLSYMVFMKGGVFIPGIYDLVHGNPEFGVMSVADKIERGKIAKNTLTDYKLAIKNGQKDISDSLKAKFYDVDFNKEYFKYFGYSYFDEPHDLVPNVPINFYSFHIMVALGMWFILLFILTLWLSLRNKLNDKRWLLRSAIISMPLAYIASEAGWLVAEFGRQPWIINELMPTMAGASNLSSSMVQTTFWIFLLTFTLLLAVEVKIMIKQIKIGPNNGGH